jgi:hypothetical protein
MVATSPPPPVHRRPRWVWPVVGVVLGAVVVGGVAAAVVLTQPSGAPSTDFGNHRIFGP